MGIQPREWSDAGASNKKLSGTTWGGNRREKSKRRKHSNPCAIAGTATVPLGKAEKFVQGSKTARTLLKKASANGDLFRN